MNTIQDTIINSLAKVTSHPIFLKWVEARKVCPQDWVTINNTFLKRDNKKTRKDRHFLVLTADEEQHLSNVNVITGLKQNLDFQHYQSGNKSISSPEPISAAIESQLENVGKILFTLIGVIKEDSQLEENFSQAGFERIQWNPYQPELLKIENQVVFINNPFQEDGLWVEFRKCCDSNGININSNKVLECFESALDALQCRAEAKLDLPDKSKADCEGITDSIVKVLLEHREEYCHQLTKCQGSPDSDREAFTQVLRLAYNFSNDAIPYLQLIIEICDLKPILFWMTVGEHYELSETLRALPWTRSSTKAIIKSYTTAVGDARNRAFHNVFPFQKALRLTLPDGSISQAEMRIFSEHNPRNNLNEFVFQDKEMIDILLGFTRARQRPVPFNFWEKNLIVMDKVIDVFSATSNALKRLYHFT